MNVQLLRKIRQRFYYKFNSRFGDLTVVILYDKKTNTEYPVYNYQVFRKVIEMMSSMFFNYNYYYRKKIKQREDNRRRRKYLYHFKEN